MKYFIILFSLVTICNLSFGQKIKKTEVPSYIVSKFETIYPTAEKVTWFKRDSTYETQFNTYAVKSFYEKKLVEAAVEFSDKGNLLEYREEIDPETLPKEIADSFAQSYPGKKIKGARLGTRNNKTTSYTIMSKDISVSFDLTGKVIRERKLD